MIQLLIFAFFGTALAIGFYCLWVSLRAEINRAPMRFGNSPTLHPAMDTSPIRPMSTHR